LSELIGGGRYRIEQVLGTGGTATVYRCLDTRLGVKRAIKRLRPDAVRRGLGGRLETEARAMARVRHPNILAVHDVGVDDGQIFVVMELAERGSVADRLQRAGPLAPRQACVVGCAVLSALAEAHRHGIVHRDVKPQNIVLTALGVPMLMDFGIASVPDEATYGMTATGTQLGTLAYMSPEQRVDPRRVDARSDLYAAAATLCVLLTVRNPVDLHSLDAQHDLLRGVPPPIARVIAKGARYRAADRYATADEMHAALVAAMDELPADPPDTPTLDAIIEAPLPESRAEPTGDPSAWSRFDASSWADSTPVASSTSPYPQAPFDRTAARTRDDEGPLDMLDTPNPIESVRLRDLPEVSGARPAQRRSLAWVVLPALAVIAGVSLWWGMRPEAAPVEATDPTAVVAAATEDPTPVAAELAPPLADPGEADPVDVITDPVDDGVDDPVVPSPSPPPRPRAPEPAAVASAAPPEVAPPDVAPPPAPAIPSGFGSIRVTGDASSVVFIDLTGRRSGPGLVPVGAYRIEAVFSGVPTDAGRIVVGEGDQLTLGCQTRFLRCSAN
jgi:serine/threonine-protein kinase